jgi:prepilin-type N-terminal cleavage/methylation domain-containing protein
MVVKDTNNLEAGFSLIELMISLAIFGMVLAGIVAMFTSTGRHHTGQEMMVEVAQDLRAARNLMVDEIRSAGCNPKEQGRMGFVTDGDDRFNTDANSIHFTRDIDNGDGDAFYESDGDARDANEEIRYYRIDTNGNILFREILRLERL